MPAAAHLDPRDKAEWDAVGEMRNYRLKNVAGPLRILRGEFHRHSEISMDGGNDGTIIDQYRYMLDASTWIGWAAAITTTARAASTRGG